MPKVAFTTRKTTTAIVIHCAATQPKADIGVREIRQWHRKQGWLDVGYHYVIRRDGTLEEGRSVEAVGSHVAGHNAYTIGVCLVGGVDSELKPEANFTAHQMDTLQLLIDHLKDRFPTVTKVCGHRDLFAGKACPSFDVAHWLETGELKP